MRAAVVVTGVLGAGTAFVFAAAAVVSTLFPSGALVPSGWNGGCMDCGGWGKPGVGIPMPMPVPASRASRRRASSSSRRPARP